MIISQSTSLKTINSHKIQRFFLLKQHEKLNSIRVEMTFLEIVIGLAAPLSSHVVYKTLPEKGQDYPQIL